ncbi:hypothetical protein KR074_011548, partial [Drosophila pseudoananassae]
IMATLTSLSHFELFRILDYMKWNCERQNSLQSIHLIKYLDIFNFALTCKKLRRIVWDWSKDIYYQLEINPLHKHLHKDMNVSFNKIHSILKRTTRKGKENIIDIFLASIMKEVTLNSIELTYKPQENITNHEEIFEMFLKAIRGETARRQFCVLNPNALKNLGDLLISDLGHFRHISKLSLTASFEIADLIEFCKQNPSLVSLDINVSSFADHRYLSEIADHCPLLKQLKFVLNDNAGEKEYVRLANLVRLQKLEIVKTPSHTDDMENYSDLDFEGLTPKRLRIEPENEALSGNINNTFESNVALHELLKAILAKKRSLLVNLALKFDVEDEIVQTIAKIKSLRVLKCGLCDYNSITHLKDSPVLSQLSLLNKGHLISEDIVHLLKKQVKVSSLDAKMNLSQRGSLYIETNNAAIYTNINVEPLLKIKNLNCVTMSNDLFKLRGSCLVRLLEQGV